MTMDIVHTHDIDKMCAHAHNPMDFKHAHTTHKQLKLTEYGSAVGCEMLWLVLNKNFSTSLKTAIPPIQLDTTPFSNCLALIPYLSYPSPFKSPFASYSFFHC